MPCITPLYHLLRRNMRPVIAGGGAHPRLFAGFAGVNCVLRGFWPALTVLESEKAPNYWLRRFLDPYCSVNSQPTGPRRGVSGSLKVFHSVKSASTRRYGHFQTGCEAASVSTLRRQVLGRRYVSSHAYLRMDGRNDRFLRRSGDLDRTVFQRCYRTRQDRVLLPRQRLSRRIFSRLDFHAASNPDCRSRTIPLYGKIRATKSRHITADIYGVFSVVYCM